MNSRKLLNTSIFILAALSTNLCAETKGDFYYSDNQADAEQATPLIDLLKLIQDKGLSVAIDRELLVMQKTQLILSKGVWLDSEVAAYKNKFDRLPAALPLSREKTEEEIAAYKIMQDVKKAKTDDKEGLDVRMVASDSGENNETNPEPDFKQSPLGLTSSNKSNTSTLGDGEKLAEMTIPQRTSEDVYYIYVSFPKNEDAKNALVKRLVALLSDDFQKKLDDNGFVRLPKQFIKLWKVSLGLAEPLFPGGYQ